MGKPSEKKLIQRMRRMAGRFRELSDDISFEFRDVDLYGEALYGFYPTMSRGKIIIYLVAICGDDETAYHVFDAMRRWIERRASRRKKLAAGVA